MSMNEDHGQPEGAGHPEEAARLETDLARKALENNDREKARKLFYSILTRLSADPLASADSASLFVTACLDLSDLSFVLGKGFGELVMFLRTALETAEQIGDRRSHALINLHLGRLFYFSERRHKAMTAFEKGKSEAEALGDEDILIRSAEFVGLYYHTQGLFKKAVRYFEQAIESFEQGETVQVINPSSPIWLGYCATYLGQFHRAIGTLDYYYRFSLERKDISLATTIRSVLGIVLLHLRKKDEASFHLSGALQEAITTGNALALYFTRGGLACFHLMEGRLREARDGLIQCLSEGANSGLIRQYASPMILEMIYELHRAGLSPVPGFSFHREILRIMQEPNIHLRGVALRLSAVEKIAKEEQPDAVRKDLEDSEACLIRAGTPVQLAKTRLELVRLNLKQGKQEEARLLARRARKNLSGYVREFYPDDLRHLISVKGDKYTDADSYEEFLIRFMDTIRELMPANDPDTLLHRAVRATNRFFGAERGGLFWFGRGRKKKPVLRAACNMTEKETASENFRSNLALIFKAYRENSVQTARLSANSFSAYREKALLCLPFEVRGEVRGVLYHDNSYLKECFDFLSKTQLRRLARSLSSHIEHIFELSRNRERIAVTSALKPENSNLQEIVAQSPVMIRVLGQTDRIALSDSTVLILGETGVGKELLARRIHTMSRRHDKPLVIVDPTVIPENLVESELFGHEKGAFTGADSQRIGRMELAHEGTLFIDEIGEVPGSLQVKLLRVLQEKSLTRVGGTRSISSDFRLVAATNRDLAQEVAAGRFREDLYYRLNVIPVVLPPLRERIEDVPLLARHFLRRYAVKYNHPDLEMTPTDEAMLLKYNWPGNIRELQNIMERAVLLSDGHRLALNLPEGRSSYSKNPFEDMPSLEEMQRRYIRYVLEKTGGKISGPDGAAERLGMKRTTLYTRMKKLGMR
ncbi:sigma-54-dependent Fis family transcriptional re gulator [Desulfonema ishimotonii]|uniref:Sigma-54-dependent Fis family transcriptional re gulator n=1 Tax=Desulfonema ishimotonii TaxID=45657 RepID=A0A401FY42_9BACT|nr:sigma 54-interacting transcriptional regulator [Desulfonema ishimotonii]GBC61866.1 sigma-54-dependent Fis family transcriptional re gulator [Desulfonema ishimotonii]